VPGENHRVFGCEIHYAVDSFDTDELCAIGWFSFDEVKSLEAASRLHTGFELAAIKAFRRLRRTRSASPHPLPRPITQRER
jgi:hypothetical protein